MTPSPTPTPTTDACFYRDAQFNGSTVHVLVDAFGRILVMDDDGTYYGEAWNDNGLALGFESDGDHANDFNAIRTAWGENDCITDITDENVTFTDAEGNSVLLTFDSETKKFVPTVGSLISNNVPTMFKRQLNNGTRDNWYIVDKNGKICTNDGVFFYFFGEELMYGTNASELATIIAAAGGETSVTYDISDDGECSKITLGGYSIVWEVTGAITMGTVDEWTPIHYRQYGDGEFYYLVDEDGKLIVYNTETNRGFYAYVEDYDGESWDESGIDTAVAEAWGTHPVEFNGSRFTIDGLEVSFSANKFTPNPTEFVA